MILVTKTVPALELAVTGAQVQWWLYGLGAVLLVGGALFFLLRKRGSDEPEPPVAPLAAEDAPIIAAVDPTVGDGPGTTPVPTEVPDEDMDIFKPADEALPADPDATGAEGPSIDFGDGTDDTPSNN